MNWENLQKNKCPHCDGGLEMDEESGEMACTSCLFHIEYSRYESIREHRRQYPAGNVKMRWQNLHDDRCPMCGGMLRDKEGPYRVLRCSNGTCTFQIREDRMAAILEDEEHPANRFYKQQDEDTH